MWRAPLAGLASLAMVATMGVAASTANAGTADGWYDVTVKTSAGATGGATLRVWDGESVAEAAARLGVDLHQDTLGLLGYSTDLTAPVHNDLTVTPNNFGSSDRVAVKFVLNDNSAQFINGDYTNIPTTVYVKKGATIGEYFKIADAANNQLVSSWKITSSTDAPHPLTGQSLEDVLKYGVGDNTGATITVEPEDVDPASKITFKQPSDWSNITAHLVGSYLDDNSGDYTQLSLDKADGDSVAAPSYTFAGNAVAGKFSYVTGWKDSGNKTLTADTKVNGNTTFDPITKTQGVVVSFDSDGGTPIAPVNVNEDHTIDEPKAPTKDNGNYTFKGWSIAGYTEGESDDYTADGGAVVDNVIKNFGGVYFNKNVTLKALWAPNYDIKVTFHYGNYKNAPADKSETYKASDFVTEPEAPTRDDGFVFVEWVKSDGTKFDFNNTLAANGANPTNNFVLTAKWRRAYDDQARAALNYVQSKDYKFVNGSDTVVAGYDQSKYFTKDSYAKFLAEYEKAYKQYRSAYYTAPNNEVDSKTAADVISTLQAAWKDLRFTSEYADTVLDGKDTKANATAKVIYRLNRLAGLHHLLSGDETEVLQLTNTNFGQGGWTKDETTFRTVNNLVFANGKDDKDGYVLSHPEWVSGTKYEFSPLLKQVTRLYNAQLQEHMYTSDANEIAVLTAGDWTKDSNLASFYVPALYTTKTKVVRLYNPGTHLHLYTSDTNEVNVLTTKGGWTLDGDAASFYAL